MSEVLATRGQQ
jgi:hypothetical protein